MNLWAKAGTWTDRRQIIAKSLRALDPDLMALQEAVKNDDVVLAGDLDATPEAASIRFLEGLQSLDGMSVCYRDPGASCIRAISAIPLRFTIR